MVRVVRPSRAISPKPSPTPMVRTSRASSRISTWPLRDDVEAVSQVPGLNTSGPWSQVVCTAFWASCSIAGTGSGRSIGTCRSSRWPRCAPRRPSMRRRAPPQHAATGATEPTPTRAASAPTVSTSSGPASEPRPTAQRAEALQHAEGPGQHVSGTIRATSVNAVTSTIALPTPITPAASQHDGVLLQQPHHTDRRAPQHDGDREPAGHRPAADQQGGQGAADEGTDAHRALDHARRRTHPASSRSIDTTTTSTVNAPRITALQHHEEEDSRDAAVPPDCVQPLAHLGDQFARPAAAAPSRS